MCYFPLQNIACLRCFALPACCRRWFPTFSFVFRHFSVVIQIVFVFLYREIAVFFCFGHREAFSKNMSPIGFLGFQTFWVQPGFFKNLPPMDFLAFQPLWVQPGLSGYLTPNDWLTSWMYFFWKPAPVPNLILSAENRWMQFSQILLAVPKPTN